MNPFDTEAGACVPVLPCLDSAKRKIFVRGTGYVQPNGFGCINAATSLCADGNAVSVTTGAGTGNSINTTTTANYAPNSELIQSNFTEQLVQGRVVGCGIRVRYTGKAIDMSGTIYALEEPSHLNTSAYNVAKMEAFDKVKKVPFGRDWVVATWQPVLPAEYAFSTNAYCSPYSEPNAPLIIMMQTQANTGNEVLSFEWEYFLHYESIGSSARGKSASHMAPIAGPNVMAALSKAPSRMFDEVSNHRASADRLSNAMIDLGSSFEFGSLAKKVLHTGVGALTSRAASQYMAGGLMAIGL
jgi:hypothetical protein